MSYVGALMFPDMSEYCDAPQSKEKRNREYKVCLCERTILRLLDQGFIENIEIAADISRFKNVDFTNIDIHSNGITYIEFQMRIDVCNKPDTIPSFQVDVYPVAQWLNNLNTASQ